jgi:hypothetical protein
MKKTLEFEVNIEVMQEKLHKIKSSRSIRDVIKRN